MSGITPFIARHPLAAFVALAYALSWWTWVLYVAYPGSSPSPLFPFGPLLAAVIVLAVTSGKSGIKDLLRRLVRWRVGLEWYGAALLVPLAVAVGAVVLNVLLGAEAPSSSQLAEWPSLFLLFPMRLLLNGPFGEEPGWRGYALPRLQSGMSPLAASLVLGIIWAVWHVPLYATGLEANIAWPSGLLTVALAILLTWIYNNTNGSILLVILCHASANTFGGGFFSPMFSGADAINVTWLMAALYWLAAFVVVLVAGPSLRTAPRVRPSKVAARGG